MNSWLKKLGIATGIWAMENKGEISWSYDPEDRYGGHLTCSWNGVSVFVDFDQERKTLEVHQLFSYMRGSQYISQGPLWHKDRQKATINNIAKIVQEWLLEAYRAQDKLDDIARKDVEQEEIDNREEISAKAQFWKDNNVPGLWIGEVIEDFGFGGVISIHTMGEIKKGDKVWVLAKKPVLEEFK